MKKALIIGVVVTAVLTLVLSGFGAVYLYAQTAKPQSVLAKNAKALNNVSGIETLSVETKDNGKIHVITGIDLIDKTPEDNNTARTFKTYKFDDSVKVTTNTYSVDDPETPHVADKELDFSGAQLEEFVLFVFKDKDKWNNVTKNGGYKIENVKVDGKDMWKIILENKEVNDLILEQLKSQFAESGSASYDTSKMKLDFKGQIRLTLHINKENNLLYSLDMSVSDDLKIDFGITFSELIGVPSENETSNLTVTLQKDYEQTNKVSELKFKDANFKVTPDKILGIY